MQASRQFIAGVSVFMITICVTLSSCQKQQYDYQSNYSYFCDSTYPKPHWPANIPNTTVIKEPQSVIISNFIDSAAWLGSSASGMALTRDGGLTWTHFTFP